MRRTFRSLLLSTAALAGLLAAGCTDTGTPTSVSSAPPARSTVSTPALAPIARYTKKPALTIAWAKKWIGPQGGRLDFMGFAVDVPAGAVDKVTQFTIRLPVDPHGSEHVVAEFLPHGSRFRVPVTLEFPFQGTDIYGDPGATVLWWNNGWVDMGASVTADGRRLRTRTDHFSQYGTSALRIGTITTSGG
jgi:hypothetical protein